MDCLYVFVLTVLASLLTFFSGFGLSTLLLPLFLIVYKPALAIALVAFIHLSSNIFKLIFTAKETRWEIVLYFGLTAAPSACLGALLLVRLQHLPVILSYAIGEHSFAVTPLKIVLGLAIVCLSLLEINPKASCKFDKRLLPLGGALSGFFGGLSGQQGALRGVFLIKMEMSKESYIATSAAIASLVDISRLSLYVSNFQAAKFSGQGLLLLTALLATLLGTVFGHKFLKKVTVIAIERLVANLIILSGLALIIGLAG